MRWALDTRQKSKGLNPDCVVVLCFLTRHFTLTISPSIHVYLYLRTLDQTLGRLAIDKHLIPGELQSSQVKQDNLRRSRVTWNVNTTIVFIFEQQTSPFVGPRRFTCECAKLAEGKNYEYFGIEYYGECWGGGDSYNQHGASKKCTMVKENECGLMECSTQRNNSKMCVGEDYALYVYTIKPERK